MRRTLVPGCLIFRDGMLRNSVDVGIDLARNGGGRNRLPATGDETRIMSLDSATEVVDMVESYDAAWNRCATVLDATRSSGGRS